jgi:hypothetical protein
MTLPGGPSRRITPHSPHQLAQRRPARLLAPSARSLLAAYRYVDSQLRDLPT